LAQVAVPDESQADHRGRPKMPEPSALSRPWYVLGLLLVPLASIVFVLAGWWKHYWPVLVVLGFAFAILSLGLQHRDHLRRKSAESS
jgi:hypothetical protein